VTGPFSLMAVHKAPTLCRLPVPFAFSLQDFNPSFPRISSFLSLFPPPFCEVVFGLFPFFLPTLGLPPRGDVLSFWPLVRRLSLDPLFSPLTLLHPLRFPLATFILPSFFLRDRSLRSPLGCSTSRNSIISTKTASFGMDQPSPDYRSSVRFSSPPPRGVDDVANPPENRLGQPRLPTLSSIFPTETPVDYSDRSVLLLLHSSVFSATFIPPSFFARYVDTEGTAF